MNEREAIIMDSMVFKRKMRCYYESFYTNKFDNWFKINFLKDRNFTQEETGSLQSFLSIKENEHVVKKLHAKKYLQPNYYIHRTQLITGKSFEQTL